MHERQVEQVFAALQILALMGAGITSLLLSRRRSHPDSAISRVRRALLVFGVAWLSFEVGPVYLAYLNSVARCETSSLGPIVLLGFAVVAMAGLMFLVWLDDGRFSKERERLSVVTFLVSTLGGYLARSPARRFLEVMAAIAFVAWGAPVLWRTVLGIGGC